MFSKACEYSIRATLLIASRSAKGERTNLKLIADEIDSPEAFTAKILQQLVRSGIIKSVKGIQGGFEIPDKQLPRLRLCDVVKAVDGDGNILLVLERKIRRQGVLGVRSNLVSSSYSCLAGICREFL